MKWEDMTPRERDAKTHECLFSHPIEWRICAREPDCGGWEEVQHHYPELQEGENCWVSPLESGGDPRAHTIPETLWHLIRATPEQRCYAAWMTLGGTIAHGH